MKPRAKWAIVGVLALANVCVIAAMAMAVWRTVSRPAAPLATLVATPTPLPSPSATRPATWTPSPSPTPEVTPTPRPSATPTVTPTRWPTFTPTPTATATPAPVVLKNPGFEGIGGNEIPYWQTGGFVNWYPGDKFDPVSSYAQPRFKQAQDPRQWITGPTLQIDTEPWVKLKAWVYQTVEVPPGTRVQFRARALGFVKELEGGYILRAGIDPNGGAGCDGARWSDNPIYNQNAGIVTLTSPRATAGAAGRVTVCLFAETQYAQAWHAAFFDDAELLVGQ